jgi:hypothetical protein
MPMEEVTMDYVVMHLIHEVLKRKEKKSPDEDVKCYGVATTQKR